jgi:hypothetical protein
MAADKQPCEECKVTGCECFCHEMRRLEREEKERRAAKKKAQRLARELAKEKK